jgi:hypothetical protein
MAGRYWVTRKMHPQRANESAVFNSPSGKNADFMAEFPVRPLLLDEKFE